MTLAVALGAAYRIRRIKRPWRVPELITRSLADRHDSSSTPSGLARVICL